MIKEFVNAWDKNKSKLEDYISARCNENKDCWEYKDLVKLIFEYVINPFYSDDKYNTEKITTIDDGNYQGTLIFVIPKNCYEPFVDDYIFTYVYYGSCSGCDTLQNIKAHSSIQESVKLYMELCLHLLQKMNKLYKEQGEDNFAF